MQKLIYERDIMNNNQEIESKKFLFQRLLLVILFKPLNLVIEIGLGLHMSKDIIEKHLHGKLSVENINRGSRFTIILPIS